MSCFRGEGLLLEEEGAAISAASSFLASQFKDTIGLDDFYGDAESVNVFAQGDREDDFGN